MSGTDAGGTVAGTSKYVVGVADDRPPGRYVNGAGYAYYQVRVNGVKQTVQEHQLVALLDGEDPDQVFSNGEWQVHHEHNVGDRSSRLAYYLRQFNYSENLTLMQDSAHAKLTNGG